MSELIKLSNSIEQLKTKNIFNDEKSEKISILVKALRIVANDEDIASRTLFIPDNCEKYGFAEGYHELGTMFYFLADMLEE